jgi:hypothetical protein
MRLAAYVRGRRRVVAASAVVVAGVAAIAWAVWPTSAWTFGPAPRSYVVVYRNVVNGVTQWEVLAAQRPFAGSDLTYRTAIRPESDAVPDAGTISTQTGLYTQDARGVRLVSGRQPGPASDDLWLAIEMRDALTRGVAVDLHRSQAIAQRKCAMFRLADPASGPLHALDMSVGHDDVCLARDGLLLSETWTYHGSVVEQRTAVSVDVGAWPRGTPRPGSTDSALPASSSAAVVTPDTQPDSFLAAPAAPTGFRQTMSPVAFRLPDSTHPEQTVASTVVWAFTQGAAVITVEAGRERGGALPWSSADSPTRPLRLPGFGTASTALRSDGPEVRVDLGDGLWVRVRGTVSVAVLERYAATLRLR